MCTFPCQKFALIVPPSHFPSLPSRRGHLYETSKNSIKLIPKTIGNRKRDCAWGCAGVKRLKKINCWAQIITRRSRDEFWWFVLNNWFFFNFLTPAHPHAQSLFLFPIVFGINVHLFYNTTYTLTLASVNATSVTSVNARNNWLQKMVMLVATNCANF